MEELETRGITCLAIVGVLHERTTVAPSRSS